MLALSTYLIFVASHERSAPTNLSTPSRDVQCKGEQDPPDVERFGGDYAGVRLAVGVNASMDFCLGLCCNSSQCLAVSFNNPQPAAGGNPGDCIVGEPCCRLKSVVNKPINNTYGPSVRTAVVTSRPPRPAPGPWPIPPAARSTFITGVTIDSNTTVRTGVEGDTWPSTTTADGRSWAMGCDNKPPGQDFAFMNW